MAERNTDTEWRARAEDISEVPMALLSILLLVLIGLELAARLTPAQARLVTLGEWIIWALFVLHFLIMFSLAESKRRYLRRNWLVVLSLFIPVLRIFAIARAVSALRAITATRVVAYTNRALRQLGQILPARRIVFAVASTLVVILAAAVGLLALERDAPGSTITSFGEALWFATRATMELDVNIEPVTAEGRVLSILVSLYGKAVFGVVTAALASWFIAIDRRVEEQRQRADG